jgi:hypothetical protein
MSMGYSKPWIGIGKDTGGAFHYWELNSGFGVRVGAGVEGTVGNREGSAPFAYVECREYSRVCPTVVPDLFDYKFSPGDDDADSKIESQ